MPEQPFAYFITFRCYGTWLAGDERGWHGWNSAYGQAPQAPHPGLAGEQRRRMLNGPVLLNELQRAAVERTIHGSCRAIGWTLHAVNARANHVHSVLTADIAPERVMTTLKAWSTRELRALGLAGHSDRLWSRHGSTVYLWSELDVERACGYVLDMQTDS